ncbi:MAG TPA: ABC transporter substrate-binding protein [Ktedonobacterales bacterium]
MAQKSMRKRFGAFAALVALTLATILAGCGSSGSSSKVTITYLTHWSGPQIDQIKQAIANYNKIEPNVTIQVRNVPFGNLLTTITTQAGSSSGPTIMGIYDLWMPQLVQNGVLAAAPDTYTQDIQGAFPKSIASGVSVDNKIYGYPNEIDLYALNYNKALFQEAGISAPPKTWSELVTDAQKLTKRDSSGKITQQGFGIITSWNSGVVHPWLSLVNSNGGELLSADHKPQLNSTAVQQTADLYHQLIAVDHTTDPAMGEANASTTGPFLDNFANGKTAMIIMANWWESALKDSMKDKFANVATAPIPVGPSGSGSHSVSYSWSDVVSAHATPDQQAAAWKFLKWLNGADSGKNGSSAMGDILMGMGILPSRTSDIQAHQSELSDPFIKTYVDEMANAMPFPIVLGGDEITTKLQKDIESLDFGQATSQQAMSQAQSDLTQILGQYYNS